jgi:ribosomal protein S27E
MGAAMNDKCTKCGKLAVYFDTIRKIIRCHACGVQYPQRTDS